MQIAMIQDVTEVLHYTCIFHYTPTVSEETKDTIILFGLWDMTWRTRDCLGCKSGALQVFLLTYLLTYYQL